MRKFEVERPNRHRHTDTQAHKHTQAHRHTGTQTNRPTQTHIHTAHTAYVSTKRQSMSPVRVWKNQRGCPAGFHQRRGFVCPWYSRSCESSTQIGVGGKTGSASFNTTQPHDDFHTEQFPRVLRARPPDGRRSMAAIGICSKLCTWYCKLHTTV